MEKKKLYKTVVSKNAASAITSGAMQIMVPSSLKSTTIETQSPAVTSTSPNVPYQLSQPAGQVHGSQASSKHRSSASSTPRHQHIHSQHPHHHQQQQQQPAQSTQQYQSHCGHKGTSATPSQQHSGNNKIHNNSNNNNINNNNNAIVSAKPMHTPTGSLTTDAALNAKAAAVRNKNEEAIIDLRQRIPEIENIFDVHSRIGNGTFSTVLLGTLKKERDLPEHVKRKFAIKHHIPTSHPDRIMKELQCMAKIGGSENVVGINCCIRYNESVAFIMPYMPHDRFHDFFNKMDLAEVQYYMKNLLIALRHVHKFNVIHRDVKPSNFLYNRRKRQFLLVDFGLAQQVPTPQTLPAISTPSNALTAGNSSNNFALPATPAADGKRLRDCDDAMTNLNAKNMDAPVSPGSEINSNAPKRFRSNGPQGDHQQSSVTTVASARVANSCIVGGGGSPFKMPLKQLNEISTPAGGGGGGGGGGVGGRATPTVGLGAVNSVNGSGVGGVVTSGANGTGGASGNSGAYETPLSRQVKSATTTVANSNRSQQKIRQQSNAGGRSSASSNTNAAGSTGAPAALQSVVQMPSSTLNSAAVDNAAAKYNTNRNLSTSNNGPKCFCYGNPQVCNICLIKKEIHASRAGTPGYRPPEVLLKYPDQTTSVDIWAAGVIFLSILSSVYPFFKAPNDFVALAEMVTIFGDKTIRKTAFILDRLVTLSQRTKPLDLRKLCVRFRNRSKFSSPELLKKYQRSDGTCEVCKNCDQFYFNCLCTDSNYNTEPLDADDPFPASAYDLLYKLLEVNPHKRITAEEALRHPFFNEISTSSNSGAQHKTAVDVMTAAATSVLPSAAAAVAAATHKIGRN